jgi:hypothetical protein
MAKRCKKCKRKAVNGACYVEGGESYIFCKTCSEILETFPLPNRIHLFLMDDTFVQKIIEARERRARGESPWQQKAKT